MGAAFLRFIGDCIPTRLEADEEDRVRYKSRRLIFYKEEERGLLYPKCVVSARKTGFFREWEALFFYKGRQSAEL